MYATSQVGGNDHSERSESNASFLFNEGGTVVDYTRRKEQAATTVEGMA